MTALHSSFVLVFLFIAFSLSTASPARASFLDKIQWKIEKYFGRATVQEMRQSYGFVTDPMLKNFINDIGINLATESHRIDIPYEFYIVDTDEVNAFAAPGGFVFVTRGLMEETETEDELAAVMAHEIGHVAAKHGAKNIKKMPFILAGAAILAGKTDETTQRIAGMAFSLMQLHYSREDEYQADTLGAEYSHAANYDPSGMISFFRKLERQHPTGNINRLEVAISTHPKTTSRLARIQSMPQLQPTPENLLRLADSFFNRFYYNDAKEKYEQALETDPDNSRAAAGVGRSLLEMGDPEGAREWFSFALRLDPDNEEAFRGLTRAGPGKIVLAGTFASDNPAESDPIETATGHVRKNIPHLAEALSLSEKNQTRIEEPLKEVKASLIKNLKAYSSIARSFHPDLDPRATVVNTAADNFNDLMMLIDDINESAGDIPAMAGETARRSREISFRLQNSPHITAAAVSAAEDLDTAATDFVMAQDDMIETLVSASEHIQETYNDTHGVMRVLAETLDETDSDTVQYYSYRLNDRVERTAEHLEAIYDETSEASLELDLQRLRMRRAVLNFEAALLPPHQEVIFRKMLRRRFRIRPEFIDTMAARGLGYADAILLASRVRGDKHTPADILDSFDPDKEPLDKFLINETTDIASGLLLINMAGTDLKMLTGRRPAIDFESEPAPSPLRIAKDAGETDEFLLRAAEALEEGNPEDAVATINDPARSSGATAISHLLLGIARAALDDPNKAIEEFKHSLKKDWNNTGTHLLLAAAFADNERYEDAANEYSAALKLDPENHSVNAAAALNDAMLGKTDAAIAALKSLADSGCDNPRVYQNLGLLYYQEGFIGEAIEAFKGSLKLDPQREKLASLVEILEKT